MHVPRYWAEGACYLVCPPGLLSDCCSLILEWSVGQSSSTSGGTLGTAASSSLVLIRSSSQALWKAVLSLQKERWQDARNGGGALIPDLCRPHRPYVTSTCGHHLKYAFNACLRILTFFVPSFFIITFKRQEKDSIMKLKIFVCVCYLSITIT